MTDRKPLNRFSAGLSVRSGLVFVCLLGITGWSFSAHAIVDVHEQYFASPDSSRLSSWSFDVSGATGNDDRQAISVETHNLLRRERSTWMLVANYAKAESNDLETEDNQFAHLRYVHKFEGGQGAEVFAQVQRNRFQKLASRQLLGGGYRWDRSTALGPRRLFGIGLFHEQEELVALAEKEKVWRGNLYATFNVPLDLARGSSLNFSAYVQPDIENFADLRSIAVAKFVVQLTDRLSIDFTLAYDHDSKPAFGVDAQNFRYSSGPTYIFKD